mgnify:CR=1 FL=1
MAVPSEAYQIYSLRDTVDGNLRQTFKFAKFTSPYTTLEEAKTLFRLDGAILEGTSSFIGYVNINSENSAYHNINRMDSYIFSNKKLLTDAGLNTLGYCETQTNILKYANLVLNNAYFKSAFYVNSSAFGLKYDIKEKNYESETLQRFVAYRSICRPINYRVIAPLEDMLNADIEFRKEVEGSIRSYFRIFVTTSQHVRSFKKYESRLKSVGIRLPDSIRRKILQYLQSDEDKEI